jgi:hypothetical protein
MDYTKGPWEWVQYHDAHTALIRTANLNPGDKRTVLFHAAAWEILPADKNLIKAAPDMYEALKAWQEYLVNPDCGRLSEAQILTDKALRKAEGRTD